MDSSFNENNSKIINFHKTSFNNELLTNTLDFSEDSHITVPLSLDLFNRNEFILSFYVKIK